MSSRPIHFVFVEKRWNICPLRSVLLSLTPDSLWLINEKWQITFFAMYARKESQKMTRYDIVPQVIHGHILKALMYAMRVPMDISS